MACHDMMTLCLLDRGYNRTAANYTLPPMSTVLGRVASLCLHSNVSVIRTCASKSFKLPYSGWETWRLLGSCVTVLFVM